MDDPLSKTDFFSPKNHLLWANFQWKVSVTQVIEPSVNVFWITNESLSLIRFSILCKRDQWAAPLHKFTCPLQPLFCILQVTKQTPTTRFQGTTLFVKVTWISSHPLLKSKFIFAIHSTHQRKLSKHQLCDERLPDFSWSRSWIDGTLKYYKYWCEWIWESALTSIYCQSIL